MRRMLPFTSIFSLAKTTIAITYIWNKYHSTNGIYAQTITPYRLGEIPKKISIDIPNTLLHLLRIMNPLYSIAECQANPNPNPTLNLTIDIDNLLCDSNDNTQRIVDTTTRVAISSLSGQRNTPENAESNSENIPPKFPDTIRHIVISGGGELGFAFYSALRESNRAGFWKRENIETIYATSAGAIFSVHIALLEHFAWEIFDDFLLKRPWNTLFHVNLAKITKSFDQRGLFGRKEIDEMFVQMFNALDIPLTITMKEFYELTKVEIHIMTAELTQFELVDISYKTHPDWLFLDAVYCSACIPIFFAPHIVGDRIYLDGGLFCNYPINQCLARVENPNEILGLARRFKETTGPPQINTLADYLMFIIRTIFERISLKPQYVKNQIDFVCDEQAVNIYKLYETFQSYNSRVLLFEKGIESWNTFLEKTYSDTHHNVPPTPEVSDDSSSV